MATCRDDEVRSACSPASVLAREEARRSPVRTMVAASLLLTVMSACTSQTPTESNTTARPAADPGAADGLKAIETQVDRLSDRVRELGGRIDSAPKPAPVDLAPLRTKIDEIARSTEGVASITKVVDSLEGRLGALDKSIADLRSEIASLKAQAKSSPSGNKPDDAGAAAIERGAELYQANKFKEASAVFRKLTETNPDDARGWYFSALSTGFATGDWRQDDSDASRLAKKGVEREKAGTPEKAKIDATFAKLTNAQAKGWLDWYRKTARK